MITVNKEFHEKILAFFRETIVKKDRLKLTTSKIKHGGKYLTCSVRIDEFQHDYHEYTCMIGDIVMFTGFDYLAEDIEHRRNDVVQKASTYYKTFADYVLFVTGTTDAADDHREGFDLDTAFGLKFMFKKEENGYVGMIKQNFGSDKVLWAIEEHYEEGVGTPEGFKSFTLFSKMVNVLVRSMQNGIVTECEIDPHWFKPSK